MKKNTNEIIDFFIYLINNLNLPTLRSNKAIPIIKEGDCLNIIAQPIKKQLEDILEKTTTEEEINYVIKVIDDIKEIYEKNNSSYFFYELLNKNYLGIIETNYKIKDYNIYKTRISSIKEDKIKLINVKILNKLENTKNINYKSNKNFNLEKGIDKEFYNNILFCNIINLKGENIKYEVGKSYNVILTGIKKIGDVYVSFITKDIGKTVDNKNVHLKVVYKSLPKKLKFPTNLKIKIRRIIEKENLLEIKAYPYDDNLY